MNSTKNVIFSLFLTSNIFIEEFTHAWVIFVMIISRLKGALWLKSNSKEGHN